MPQRGRRRDGGGGAGHEVVGRATLFALSVRTSVPCEQPLTGTDHVVRVASASGAPMSTRRHEPLLLKSPAVSPVTALSNWTL